MFLILGPSVRVLLEALEPKPDLQTGKGVVSKSSSDGVDSSQGVKPPVDTGLDTCALFQA